MPRSLVIMLAFVAGWVDAGSFVGLDHVMAAHITGNLVVLAANLEEGFEGSDTLKLIILPVFFLAVMIITVIHDRMAARNPEKGVHLDRLLLIEAVMIAATGLLGVWVSLTGRTLDFWLAILIVTPVIFGMAMQNAAHRLYPAIGPATTAMTGNITQFFIDRMRQLLGRVSVSKIDDMPANPWVLPPIILAFGFGCALGAIVTGQLGIGAFLVPAAVVAASACLLRNALRRC